MLRGLRAFLVIALLVAWQGSLLHPLQHVDHSGRLVHLQDGETPASGSVDGLCDALAALGACLGASPAASFEPLPGYLLAFRSPAAVLTASAPPFLAQGPPPLL
jgi:hypothetical protein